MRMESRGHHAGPLSSSQSPPYHPPAPLAPSNQRPPSVPGAQLRPPLQPLYMIPMSGASAPVLAPSQAVMDLSHNPRPSLPAIAPRLNPPSARQARNRPTAQLDDREISRRIKKQELERRRRACISKKLSTINNQCNLLHGQKPPEQSQQRTEIMDILTLCQEVLEENLAFLKRTPGLFDEHQAFIKAYAEEKRQTARNPDGVGELHQSHPSKENAPPRPSAFTPVAGFQKNTASTPVDLPRPFADVKCSVLLSTPEVKRRESLDSGFGQSSELSVSESSDAHLLPPPVKRPRALSSQSKIWRPYADD